MEKRRESRVDVSWPVCVAGISGSAAGRLVNISLCGALFTADVELQERELLILRIVTDTDGPIDCAAQVVRVHSCDGVRAYGVDFLYFSATDRQKLSFALLLRREPVLYRCHA